MNLHQIDRRQALRGSALAMAFFTVPGLYAEQLQSTPRQTAGPFFPDTLPLDTDNDLLIINQQLTPAAGVPIWLSGRILDQHGQPLRGATVEIWQTDNNGIYLHSRGGSRKKLDGNFQGYGRFLTGSKGEYLFRTIKPTRYPGRTPHIHFAVKFPGKKTFTTQCYIAGEAGNKADGLLNRVKNLQQRNSLIVDFKPVPGSKMGELMGTFDIILGITPVQP